MSPVPVIYLSHGGGPMPVTHNDAVSQGQLPEHLRLLGSHVRKANPSAILIISAHWEEENVAVNSGKEPSLLFDYYGFPRAAYELKYPAPGSPNLAGTVVAMLRDQGIATNSNDTRGWDHGIFIPLLLMLPEASIPVLQISLLKNLSAEAHLQLGRALSALRNDNVVIVGSGSSYHNMRGFGGQANRPASADSLVFHDWLRQCMSANASDRWASLVAWQTAPSARACHPREEHLLPLHVCVGAAGDDAGHIMFEDDVFGVKCCAITFGHMSKE